MIHSTDKPIAVVALAQHEDFMFYLTGSRYFGGAHTQSDWDFFTSYTPEIEEFLVECGFVRDSQGYKDATVIFVHRMDNVHVQLVDDVSVKLEAQKMLRPFLMLLPKQYHKVLWMAAIQEVMKSK